MKHKLIATVLTTGILLGATVHASTYGINKNFNGPYLNIGSGLSQQHYKSTGTGKNSALKSHIGAGITGIVPSSGLFYGIETQLGMNNTLKDRVDSSVFDNLGTSQGYKVRVTETTNDLAVLGKIGVPLLRNTVVYGFAGPDLSGFKVNAKSKGAHRDKESMKLGLATGAGVETYLTENVTAGITYTQTIHNNIKSANLKEFFSDLGAGNVQVDNKKIKLVSNTVKLELGYRF